MKNFFDLIRKNKKKSLVLLVLLLFLSHVGAIMILATHDSYKVAREFVYDSKELNDKFGKVRQVRMHLVKIGGISYRPNKATAHYYLNVSTEQNQYLLAHVRLEKIGDEWAITKYEIER
jgi:hypothetical protein